jgi:hypothetical protein
MVCMLIMQVCIVRISLAGCIAYPLHVVFLSNGDGCCIYRWLTSLFTYAGFPTLTTHSVRKSVVKWAARCKALTADIVLAGRWKNANSESFMMYYQSGELMSKKYMGRDRLGTDPIYQFWVWKPTSFTNIDIPTQRNE